ncbi:MAG: hypothetical protein KDD66_14100 [Bdellovibrionales bacterium]|nr:hypothetical protein [Bdellovibrionales bacterium]
MKRVLFLLLLILIVAAPSAAEESTLYVQSSNQKLFKVPQGAILATLDANTPVKVVEDKQEWVKVSVEGWVRRNVLINRAAGPATTSAAKPISLAEYIVEDSRKTDPKGPKKVNLTLKVKNNTNRIVKSWRAIMTVQDPVTNQVLFSISVSHDDANISPGKIGQVQYYWDWGEKQYDILLNNYPDNMKISLFRLEVNY